MLGWGQRRPSKGAKSSWQKQKGIF